MAWSTAGTRATFPTVDGYPKGPDLLDPIHPLQLPSTAFVTNYGVIRPTGWAASSEIRSQRRPGQPNSSSWNNVSRDQPIDPDQIVNAIERERCKPTHPGADLPCLRLRSTLDRTRHRNRELVNRGSPCPTAAKMFFFVQRCRDGVLAHLDGYRSVARLLKRPSRSHYESSRPRT